MLEETPSNRVFANTRRYCNSKGRFFNKNLRFFATKTPRREGYEILKIKYKIYIVKIKKKLTTEKIGAHVTSAQVKRKNAYSLFV